MTAIALAGGAWIFLAVIVIGFFGVVYGYYTIKGSGISNSPYAKVYGGAPGAQHGDDPSGKDSLASQHNWTRGTR